MMKLQTIAVSAALACLMSLAAFAPAAETAPAGQAGANASGKPMAPEFGPSVVFDPADFSVQLSDLRGKMVLVVFFQSWCPICNGWSPELLQQMTKNFGDDPAVVLVALKVDGGSPAEAKAYLRGKNADLSKWIVASDTGGLYYQRVAGTDALWGYALIDEEGRLVEHGQAGSFYPQGAGKRFVLADTNLKQKAPNAAAILPVDATTPTELKPIAHAAEMGHYGAALRALKSYERGKDKEAAIAMRETLLNALAARVDKASADVKSEDIEARYDGYHFLRSMSVLADMAPGKAAKATLASIKIDKAMTKELANQERAESAFWGMMTRAVRLEAPQRKSQLPDAMKQFAGSFTGTSYAERALNESQTIAGGTLTQ